MHIVIALRACGGAMWVELRPGRGFELQRLYCMDLRT